MEVIVPIEAVERRIYLIRGHKVMLDKDLAELYGVKPIRLREQVKRNMRRFPDDFMFQWYRKMRYLRASILEGISLMFSLSKESQCLPRF